MDDSSGYPHQKGNPILYPLGTPKDAGYPSIFHDTPSSSEQLSMQPGVCCYPRVKNNRPEEDTTFAWVNLLTGHLCSVFRWNVPSLSRNLNSTFKNQTSFTNIDILRTQQLRNCRTFKDKQKSSNIYISCAKTIRKTSAPFSGQYRNNC